VGLRLGWGSAAMCWALGIDAAFTARRFRRGLGAF
jgi:hypothetical protein